MKTFEQSKRAVGGGAIIAAALALMAGPAMAYDVCLKATDFPNTYPDGGAGTMVTMWGYEEYTYDMGTTACDWGTPVTTTGPSVPGPAIVVPVGDNTLNIHLFNALPGVTPTSVVIPGQDLPTNGVVRLGPVWDDESTGPRTNAVQRIRSLVHETASGMEGTYAWPNLAPGTYLYRTGTHPQVQQQMGLYGAVTHDSAAGEAYPGVTYVKEVTLLYSEVDPQLHATVNAGQYGPGLSMTSTVDYHPTFFLINGAPFDPTVASSNAFAITQNSTALIRLLNAGLMSHAPMTLGLRMMLVAEDGSPYPFPRSQYSVLLPAGKALDALVVPPDPVRYPLVDRMMALTNNSSGPGGMMAFLDAAMAPALTAANDNYGTDEDVTLNVAAPGVLGNDTAIAGETAVMATNVPAGEGVVTLNGDGSFEYVPAANFSDKTTQFTYQKTNGTQWSNIATVSISVAPLPDAPVAVADSYVTIVDTPLVVPGPDTLPGVLDNDTDPDGDVLQAVTLTGAATTLGGTVTLNADGSFSYTPPAATTGSDSFVYEVSDNDPLTANASATVTITVNPTPANVAPVAVDDEPTQPGLKGVAKGTAIVIDVLSNDYDPDGTLDPTTVEIVTGPNHGKGQVTVDPVTGEITYTADPNYGGSELFTYRVMDNSAAWSNAAKVKINLVNP